MRKFQKIDELNTVGEWIDAFNNNALASSDHTWYLGEMLFNGILYTGLETIGGVPVKSLTNLDLSAVSAQNLELDNFYLYFRDINKILLVDQVTFDLRPYATGQPMFFYIDSELGFRVSQTFKQKDNEILLFRFILSQKEIFQQCYIAAQRFGSNVYDTADEFYLVTGCMPTPITGLKLKLGDGHIKRSGVRLDYHQMPDVLTIADKTTPFDIRYIETDNTVDYLKPTTTDVIPGKILNYETQALSNVDADKFSVQRILYDIFEDCLIIQYGDTMFPTMETALASVNNTSYPFPYDSLMYIPLGLMFIKGSCTDLSKVEDCVIVQHLNTTINPGDSAFFASDEYARGRIKVLQNTCDDLQTRLTTAEGTLKAHIENKDNPHEVTKAQLGLGKVDNLSKEEMRDYLISDGGFDDRYVNVTGDTMRGTLVMANGATINVKDGYIMFNGTRLYVGGTARPSNAPDGSYGIW